MADFDGGSSGGEGASLTVDAILDVLNHRHRRDLFRLFRERSTRTLDADEAVEYLAERERRRTGETPAPDHLRITLYHVHLPKFEETGLVSLDEETGTFQYHPNERIGKWLDLVESERRAGE